jgi:hypothetical protein
LIRLRELGIPFSSLDPLPGVLTPVQLAGDIGGIHYSALGKRKLISDCRLALALHTAAFVLKDLGVQEVFFSGAYSYRTMASGKLSQHAMGLAIDMHRFKVNGVMLSVEMDYRRGLRDDCAPDSPTLNRVACLLRRQGYFDWVLTPDTDAAHYNHLHLDIYCLYRRRFIPEDVPPAAIED